MKLQGIKGVVLAGGLGKRLYPLTKITNKHLLPVYDRPMVFYPIQKLVAAGIRDIMIVTGGPFAGDFLRLLGNGSEFGLKELHYAYQEGEDGIASALGLTRNFVGKDKVCVILGDNIFADDIEDKVREFVSGDNGAHLILKEVERPERFGVACFDKSGRLVAIEEKPEKPKSRFAVTGIYMYDQLVFDVIDTLKPSSRGEYEITDVSNHYIERGKADHSVLEGWWTDAGTFESLHRAGELVRAERMRQKEMERA
jgi:glucose-1-phosphate thymidylyltransferase